MNARLLRTSLFSRTATVALASLVGFAFAGLHAADPAEAKNLFAEDLSDADNAEHWQWDADSLLVAKDHETLWTKKSYSNFVLDLDFKVAKESNSGVFIRSYDIKNVLAVIEIQVHENTDGTKYGMVAAMYDLKPPSKDMSKPVGEWNHYTITCKGSHISVVFNGEEVINANMDDWSELGKNPDGTPNKFKKAIKDFAHTGPIGLQGLHGKAQAPVWYRNLKIKVLE